MTSPLTNREKRSPFYLIILIMSVLIIIGGFGPTYISPMMKNTFVGKPFIHLHAAIFFSWTLLLVIQPSLVKLGQVHVHKKIGITSIVLALSMIVIGLTVAISTTKMSVGTQEENQAKAFLLLPITDIILFAILITSAFINFRNPEAHKRLILLATLAILPAAFARFFFFIGISNLPLTLFVMDSFLYAGIIYDLIKRRKIHSVYIWGGVLLVFVHLSRVFIMQTEIWLKCSSVLVD